MPDHPDSGEFDIIQQYFDIGVDDPSVILGVGDDAAIIDVTSVSRLCMTMDTLIEGVHFPVGTHAQDIAYKAVAVNMSDLAAMGAKPSSILMSICLPRVDHEWLSTFSTGLREACDEFGVSLIGGDTTRGSLAVSIQATGTLDPSRSLRRDAAQVGDGVYVTGTIGDAALALKELDAESVSVYCRSRLDRPTPRLSLVRELCELSRCAIDVSDGLVADVGHIAENSGRGVDIDTSSVPFSEDVLRALHDGRISVDELLTGGDDYELCFTSDASGQDIQSLAERSGVAITRIGSIREGDGVRCLDPAGQRTDTTNTGYRHF